MNRKTRFVLTLALVLFGGAALWATWSWAAPGAASPAQGGGAPTVVSYQGEVVVDSTPFTGIGYFKFAIVDAAGTTTYWSNDGSSVGGGEPTAAVSLTVSNGLFNVLLGDTSLDNMTQELTATVFEQPDRYLRVWFSDDGSVFTRLSPDTRIAAVPYALRAEQASVVSWDGLTDVPAGFADGVDDDTTYTATTGLTLEGNVFGADTTWFDGRYQQHYAQVVVVAKSGGDYVSIQAAIDSITDATAAKPYLVWVAPGIYSDTVTIKPYIHLQGAGQEVTVITSTVASTGPDTPFATLVLTSNVSLRDLTVTNEGAGSFATALLAPEGATDTLVADVTARAQGNNTTNYGIYLFGSGTNVTLRDVTALAENGSNNNYGLYNYGGATARVRGGSFTGRGGTANAYGLFNAATLYVEGVIALGENGGGSNAGLRNGGSGTVTVHGGSFTGRGGDDAYGLFNDATLDVEDATALGEDGSVFSVGLGSYSSGTVTVHGGSLTGRGGGQAYGLANRGTLNTEGVTVLGEDGSLESYGGYNTSGGVVTVHGGSLTGRGGGSTYGFRNYYGTVTIEGATLSGKNGSNNYGLHNHLSSTATATQSVIKGGTNAVYNVGGTVTLSNSRLVGGAVYGTVTCVAVSRGTTFNASGCP
ncbi:MAG TPA: hypothetical protein G4O00_10120 [Thermoflexia bacterium]|jgi:hypothetical protein|nr:hypothetical protein [Thermoflexia bacterium]